ncbi:MAG TPA: CUB domain-containing protein, partial [Saprospiraceae bacterium]|nr:CUB domain-containing protein [Saprospiraceae bacterium]
CSGGLDEPLQDAMTGCTYRAGRQSSDFMLLEMQASVPYSYRSRWNGWNRSEQAATILTMPHHPKGDIKKVTRFDDELSIRSFPRVINWTNNVTTPANYHWEAPHTSGMFEVGSSGAPALDAQGLIVGQLHGGVINCSNGISYFGKLSRSWIDVQSDGQGLFRVLSPGSPDRMALTGLDAPDSYCLTTSTFNQSSGTITDGSQTDVYLPGTNCSFLIQLPDDKKQVLVQVQEMDLGPGDSLFLYDGADASKPLLDVWTGSTANNAEMLASGHEMFLAFEANESGEKQGFELQYSSEDIGLDLQVSLDSKDSERAVVYLYDGQFFLLDSTEYDPSSPTSFESVFEIEENSGRYYLSARIYNPDWREGVSSLDLLRMEVIFRQDQLFNNLYEFLAADTDNNFEVNLSDLIGIARFVRRLEDRWSGRTYIQLYDPEALQACENANWMDCMRYTPVEYIEINSGNPDPTGTLQIRFERLQEGDLNRSARF